MKSFRFERKTGWARRGFTLVESTLSLGVLSCAFVTLAPILALGMKTTRGSRDDSAASTIVRSLVEEARQGTLGVGTTLYADGDGRACAGPNGAAYSIQPAVQALPGSISRLNLRVVPVGDPQHARVYAVVYPVAPAP